MRKRTIATRVGVQIVLVIGLSRVEGVRRLKGGGNRILPLGLSLLHDALSNGFLLITVVEDSRSILRTHVIA